MKIPSVTDERDELCIHVCFIIVCFQKTQVVYYTPARKRCALREGGGLCGVKVKKETR